MASVVDVRLIDPTEKQMAATLRKAHGNANRGLGVLSPKLDRDARFWDRFAHECLREREGRRRSCKAGRATPEVMAAWWTDPAGRKHVRVIGRTRARYALMRPEGELRELPPWWHVYPESILAVRHRDGGETFLACCRCGVVGTPESLGWMGDVCGPCFDRRADGGVPSGGFGHFRGWADARIEFTADGTCLVGTYRSNRFRMVDRADGSEILARGTTSQMPVTAIATSDGFLYGYRDGAIARWRGDRTPGVRVLQRPTQFGHFLMSPDGRRAVVLSGNQGYVADLDAIKPRYRPVSGVRICADARFMPRGNRLLGVTGEGELIAIDLDSRAETVIRVNVFAGLPLYGTLHDLTIAPDGSMVAIVRETYYPALSVVRLLPLLDVGQPLVGGSSSMRDLLLPTWHRPKVVAFSPGGDYLVTADTQAGWVGFWRRATGKPLGFVRAVPEDPNSYGGQITFSPDGKAIAVLCTGHHPERGSTVVTWPWPEVVEAARCET